MRVKFFNQEYDVHLHPSKQKFLLLKRTTEDIVLAEQKIILSQKGYNNQQLISPNILTVFYIPGWRCNMRCTYCFIGEDKNLEIDADYWAKYIYNYQNKYNFKKVNIVFFGGEPTLYLQECLLLYNSLKKLFLSKDVEFIYSMVTNGYDVLREEVIDFFNQIQMSNIQITVDCGEYYHNKYRKAANGEDTFFRILSNLDYLIELNYPITIRTNINNECISQIDFLCELLIKICNGKEIDWSIAPIMATTERNEALLNVETVKPHMQKICKMLSNECINLVPWTTNCDFFGHSVIVLNCDGKVYNCVNLCKHNYTRDRICLPNSNNQMKCELCFWKSFCGGGCKYQNYVNSNDFCSIYCLSSAYESLVEPIIMQKSEDYLLHSGKEAIALEIKF